MWFFYNPDSPPGFADIQTDLIAHDADMGYILRIPIDICADQGKIAYLAGASSAVATVMADGAGYAPLFPWQQLD